MNIIVNIKEDQYSENKIQEFQEFNLGTVTSTLNNLLNSSTIYLDSNKIPLLSVIDNEVERKFLIKSLTQDFRNNTQFVTGQNLQESDLIEIGGSAGGGGGGSTSYTRPWKFVGTATYNSVLEDKDLHIRTNGTSAVNIDNDLYADADELKFSVLGQDVTFNFINGDSLDPLNTLVLEESGTASFKRMSDGQWIMMR